jgi:hypothetical protein
MFSKRHYIAIAKAIEKSNAQTKKELAKDLAKMFEKDNQRFSEINYLSACEKSKGIA